MKSRQCSTAVPIRIIISVLLCMSATDCVQSVLQNATTCSNIKSKPMVEIFHCKYVHQTKGAVICDVLMRKDWSTEYLHIRLTLSLIDVDSQNTERNDSLCLGASTVTLDKIELKADWSNATIVKLKLNPNLEQLKVRATFDPKAPVGFLIIKPECAGGNYTGNSSCIESVQLLQEFAKPKFHISKALTPEFWKEFKEPYLQIWKMRVPFVIVVINPPGIPYTFQTLIQLLQFILNDIGLHWLRVGGLSMENLPLILPPLPELKALDMSCNGIRTIHPDNFANVAYVKFLNISRNNLSYLPYTFAKLKKVQELSLSQNPLNISLNLTSTLLNLPELKRLSLSGVPLKKLTLLQALLSKVKLWGLDLSNCELSIDKNNIFDEQTSLTVLDLSNNALRTIPPRIFANLHNLTQLHLGNNTLTQAPKLQLGKKRLELLDLSKNNLTMPDNILDSGSVHVLDLSGNAIVDWTDTDTFNKPKSWVKEVNLSHNLIASVSKKMGDSMDILQAVDLGNNSFNCANCHTAAFQHWLKNTHVLVYNLWPVTILVCANPSSDAGKPIVKVTPHGPPCESDTKTDFPVLALICVIIIIITLLFVAFKFRAKIIAYMKHRNNDTGYNDAYVIYNSSSDGAWVMNFLKARLQTIGVYSLYLQDGDNFLQKDALSDNVETLVHHSSAVVVVLSIGFIYSKSCCRLLEKVSNVMKSVQRTDFIFIELEPVDHQMLPQNLRSILNMKNLIQWAVQGEAAWGILMSSLDNSIATNRRHIEHHQAWNENTPLLAVT